LIVYIAQVKVCYKRATWFSLSVAPTTTNEMKEVKAIFKEAEQLIGRYYAGNKASGAKIILLLDNRLKITRR
jgi:hypothetical protein